MTNCNHCPPPIPNMDPCNVPTIPPHYPFNRPACDSYTYCCCGSHIPNPMMKDYPSAGPFIGSAFTLNDANPYLMDSTFMSYGIALSYADSVYTNITKRDDLSCINLAATFDMTDTNLTNTVRNDFLNQYINRKYEQLQGVLPIIKNKMKLRTHYTVTDMNGGVVYSGHADSIIEESHFHFTNIKDVFVQSLGGLVIENIPAMTFQGLYTITIKKVELFVLVINTIDHLFNGLNPFYVFTDNNTKIQLQHDVIENTDPDSEILISSCDVNRSFEYYANITTRLRMTYVAFTSVPIACGDTSAVWNSLNEPTDAVINQLRHEVTVLEEEVARLRDTDAEQDEIIAQLQGQVELNRINIGNMTASINNMNNLISNMNATITSLTERVEALEQRPYAVLKYSAGKLFQASQLTWRDYGELFMATKTFNADGNISVDIENGNLVPVVTPDE